MMDNDDCPLCKSPASMLEHLTVGYFCNGCGQVFELDEHGNVLKANRTNHTAESAFRQALRKASARQYGR
jgi:hypothetical protein